MESTALVLLALSAKLSCLGVMFGWQPMPDGSDKVEYIVQIEPELAASMRAGQSIPITSDIPADIGPIGRIRIEVGRDELPRESLATRFKPWPIEEPKKSREGLVETQFTAPSSNASGSRYGSRANNATILPPGGTQPTTSNPFGQALQQGVEQARNAAGEILPPSSDQLFGSGGNVQNELRQGFQRGVEQVADRTGQQLRQAANNVGQRANNAVNEFGRSLTADQSILTNRQASNNATILPPANANDPSQSDGPQFNQPLQPRRQQPLAAAPSSNFASSSPASNNPTSQRGDFSAPWPTTTGQAAPPATTVGNQPTRYGNGQQPQANPSTWPSQQQNQQPPRSSFDIADRQNSNPAAGDNGYGQQGFTPASNDLRGPELTMPNQQPNNQPPNRQPLNTELTSQVRTGPAVTRNMLAGQPGANLQDAGAQPNYPQQQRQFTARQPLDAQPRDLGWDQNGQQQNNSDKTVFPMLLSWVLLSGSGAGNLYLFWSYLDVRSKYRGVVHGTPMRRDRYDD